MKRLVSIEDIRGAAAATEVELSGWNPDEVFAVKLRKPGLFAMQMKGGIPNPIISTVEEMFRGKARGVTDKDHPDPGQNVAAAFYHIARAAMVDPKLEELEAAGVELTDTQMTEIYAFVLGGVPNLQRFRDTLRARASQHVEAVQDAPVGADGPDGSSGDVDGGRGDSVHDDAGGGREETPAPEEGAEVG